MKNFARRRTLNPGGLSKRPGISADTRPDRRLVEVAARSLMKRQKKAMRQIRRMGAPVKRQRRLTP
ncbi:MAG: hypothetical protein HYY15_01170 [Candidatus Omnitrophica bacterium]|nr:hypothetical protein [Candidatus Omnitrophota bacterium]